MSHSGIECEAIFGKTGYLKLFYGLVLSTWYRSIYNPVTILSVWDISVFSYYVEKSNLQNYLKYPAIQEMAPHLIPLCHVVICNSPFLASFAFLFAQVYEITIENNNLFDVSTITIIFLHQN